MERVPFVAGTMQQICSLVNTQQICVTPECRDVPFLRIAHNKGSAVMPRSTYLLGFYTHSDLSV